MTNTKASAKVVSRSVVDSDAQQVAGVYAKALVGAAEKSGETQRVLEELDSMVDDVLDDVPKLEHVLGSALVAHEDKVKLLERALAGKASKTFLNFLKVLSEHGRLDVLRPIQRAARELYDQMKGRIGVQVATADPLDPQLQQKLADMLRLMLGGEPVLETVTEPDLIGGLVLRVGDTVYDGSVATQLERVREQMIHRSVHEIQIRRDRFSSPAGN